MRILLGNNTLSFPGGSETWTQTLAIALKRAGHEVSCFAPILGGIAKQLEDEGIRCYKEIALYGPKRFSIVLEPEVEHQYDFIIANHWHIVEYLRGQFPRTPIISVIHGIIHKMPDGTDAPEHPALNSGVNQFVSVSEEVQYAIKNEYNIDSIVVRNFMDIKKFAPMKVNKTPKQFLINSNYLLSNDPEVQVIKEVARHFGAKLAAIGQNFVPNADVLKALKDADVVFGYGRSILEALACGRLAIVHGHLHTGGENNRGTGGVINEQSVELLRYMNFSGRNAQGEVWTADQFIKAIEENYNPKVLKWGPKYVAQNHNAVLAAEQFINLGKTLLGNDIVSASAPQKLKRRSDNPGIYANRS